MWIRISFKRIRICGSGSDLKSRKYPPPIKKFLCSKKLLIMLCMSLLFMCVKQSCHFYFQKYDILVILMWVSHDFDEFFATRIRIHIINPDPDPGGQNDADPKKIQIIITDRKTYYPITLKLLDSHLFFITAKTELGGDSRS